MAKVVNIHGTDGGSVTVALPKKKIFKLIDASGNVVAKSVCGVTLAIVAGQMFPDQQQDTDRTGAGWDIQVAGLR